MMRVVETLGRIAPQAMAIGVFAGLFLPDLAHLVRPLLTPSVWALLFIVMLRIDWSDVAARLRRPLLPALIVFWIVGIAPLLMAAALSPFDIRPGVYAAMVLAAGSAPLFSTPAIGLMFGLDGALLLVTLVTSTLIVPLTLPIVAGGLLGLALGAGPVELMARLSGLVLSAVAAAAIVRHVIGPARLKSMGTRIDGFTVILLIIFAVGVMDGVAARILADPLYTARVTALTFAGYGGLIALGTLVFLVAFRGRERRLALTVGFSSGCRNLAILLAALPADADPDIPLFFALGQFPIYITPALMRPLYRRLLGGPAGT